MASELNDLATRERIQKDGNGGGWRSVQAGGQALLSAALTRPADTNAYIVGDVVANATSNATLLTFDGASLHAGGGGYITKARLITNQSTNVAAFRLWLYSISNPTIASDNVPMTLLWANRDTRLGYIDFPALATELSGSDSASALNDYVRLGYVCAAADTKLYGLLQTKTAFTPASGQLFFVELLAERNVG